MQFTKLTLSTKGLFLIDGLGAFITSFFLFAILRTFNEYFGMPQKILSILSIIALLFCFYSVCCFFLVNKKWERFLQVIIIANIFYCFLTSALVLYYYPQLTVAGVIYFFLEILIICGLVFIEINVLIKSYHRK